MWLCIGPFDSDVAGVVNFQSMSSGTVFSYFREAQLEWRRIKTFETCYRIYTG